MERLRPQFAILLLLFPLVGCVQERREEVAKRYSTGQKKEVRVYEGEGAEEELIKRQIYVPSGELIRVENVAKEDTLDYSDLNPELLEPEGQKKFLSEKAWVREKAWVDDTRFPARVVQFTSDSMYVVEMQGRDVAEEAWIGHVDYSIEERSRGLKGKVLLQENSKTDTLRLIPQGPDSLLGVGPERLLDETVFFLKRASRDVQQVARTYRKERRKELRRSREGVSQEITLRPQGNQMKYGRDEFSVFAGKSVELVFENTATSPSMQHNVVVLNVAPSQAAFKEVGQQGVLAGATNHYVPDHPWVLAATEVVGSGGRVSVSFRAPEEPGNYGFVCTYPGHWATMQGTMQVVPE
jgi:azurin